MAAGVEEGSGLHSACISDPASVLPTKRRRAVNRLRAARRGLS
jgi:hypothetical protein